MATAQFGGDIKVLLFGRRRLVLGLARLDASDHQRLLQGCDIVRKVFKIGVHEPMESYFWTIVAPLNAPRAKFLAGRLRSPGLLRVAPIDALKEAGGLRRRQ